MNGESRIVCPHCEGSGVMQEYDLHETTCPLCFGKGMIPHHTETSDTRRPPPTSAQLLARIVPLAGRTSGHILVRQTGHHEPQAIVIYSDRAQRGSRRPKPA